MDFSDALRVIRRDGSKLTRLGWNASGQYVVYQPGYPDGIAINADTAKATGIPQGTVQRFRPYLMLHTAQGDFVPWTPTVSDALADDWSLVMEPVQSGFRTTTQVMEEAGIKPQGSA